MKKQVKFRLNPIKSINIYFQSINHKILLNLLIDLNLLTKYHFPVILDVKLFTDLFCDSLSSSSSLILLITFCADLA